jgi:VIT1/CCC1 family predicted Fe2+/Mn2+ transporter
MPTASYLRDWVYGGIDGTVTTFAIVAGVVGAELSSGIVPILGIANVVADGFSMAASNYSGTKTEQEEKAQLRAVEERHIETVPDGEREEIRQIFRGKGFQGADLEHAVDVITADTKRWVDTMLSEEYGLPRTIRSPLKAAASTVAAFMLCGSVPLLPFVVGAPASFEISIVITGLVFFRSGG